MIKEEMPKKMKILIVVALAAMIAGGARYYYLNKETGSASVVPVDVPENTVYITADGFVPDSLTVKAGTEVIFVNKTEEWRWPASDLHPVHNLYPEFDAKTAIGPGTEWRFKFEKPGTWGMHDHLAPYVVGKIIVEE